MSIHAICFCGEMREISKVLLCKKKINKKDIYYIYILTRAMAKNIFCIYV